MKTALFLAAAMLLSAPAFACSVTVSDSFIRVPPKSAAAGAGFMVLNNGCGQKDTLLRADADISKTVELHTHVHEGDVMRMRQVESIAVPANGQAKLQPGGDHVMFIGLTRQLTEGEQVPVTLTFAQAGKVTVNVPVVGITTAAPMPQAPAMPMDHGHMKH